LHNDFSVVRFNDVLDNAQADSNALRFAPQLGAKPIKAFENFLVFLRRNSRATILNVDFDCSGGL
jgi:hypothetical protein